MSRAIDADDGHVPLLRSPSFLYADAGISQHGIAPGQESDAAAIDGIFAKIRDARVGGGFWHPPAIRGDKTVIIRLSATAEIAPMLSGLTDHDRANALWILPKGKRARIAETLVEPGAVLAGNFDPWSLLDGEVTLLAHGDDEWLAIAEIAGCPVRVLSRGRFGLPGEDDTPRRARTAAQLSHCRYRNPFTQEATGIEAAIEQLADWRRTLDANRSIVAACGIAWWKRREIAHFLGMPGRRPHFFWSERRAIAYAARRGGAIAVWPSRISKGMTEIARKHGVSLVRIEDGFVRSAGLGSDLVPPSSIAVDHLGIHYDPSRPSDLEEILAHENFSSSLLARAEKLRRMIVDGGISKYGSGRDHAFPARRNGRRVVLVPGQVEDDMSVLLGGGGLTSNLELLRGARAREPDAEIWFRPHPDVDAGHRKGAVRDVEALEHCDRIVRGGSMARLLGQVDAVHMMTSLTGFEALMRGLDVTCHGTPFFAGWGLTQDLAPRVERRGRQLTIDQLVAAVLILYPRYLDPVTGLPCPPEILIRRMVNGTVRNRLGWITFLRRLQGQLAVRLSSN